MTGAGSAGEIVARALSSDREEFARIYRGLFLLSASITRGSTLIGTARSTPSARRSPDETLPPGALDESTIVLHLEPGAAMTLGRVGADLSVAHRSVSRRHAGVIADASFITLWDLGSQNGTRAAGVALKKDQRAVVAIGENIKLGDVELTVIDARGCWLAIRGAPR